MDARKHGHAYSCQIRKEDVCYRSEEKAEAGESDISNGAARGYCIEHDILKKILRENRVEVIGMLLRGFDVEKYERSLREEGREEGKFQGSLLMLNNLVKDGILTLSEAASRVSMTEEEEKLLWEHMWSY